MGAIPWGALLTGRFRASVASPLRDGSARGWKYLEGWIARGWLRLAQGCPRWAWWETL